MKEYAYGQQPSDIPVKALGLGWLAGVRHLKTSTATSSFWHTHPQIQLLYCIRGEFSYEFRSCPPVVLTAGHLIVIPAGMEHRLNEAIDPAGHRVELLLGTGREKSAFRLFPASLAQTLIAELSERICTPVACTRALADLFLELDGLAARGGPHAAEDLALARTLAALILQRCTAQPAHAAQPRGGTRLMDEAVAWLQAHFAEDIRMERLVAYMGYSRSRLFELFKAQTGLSPADWLARYRIKEARRLLKASAAPVAKIARACGYASPQYFNAAFRRATGLTPSQWRAAPAETAATDGLRRTDRGASRS